MQKPNWKRALSSLAGVMSLSGLSTFTQLTHAQDTTRAVTVPAGLQDSAVFQSTPIQYLPFAHFAIPFDIDRTGRLPQEVHLWVSADQGKSWLKYASNSPDKRSFEFQAAAEGEYLFAVQTQDDRGASALAAAPPMRIMVDTSRPQVQLKADINSSGRLVIDYRIEDRFLSEESVRLSYAVDGRSAWEDIRVGRLTREGNVWSGQIEQEMPRCHELELKLVASDLAQNSAETSARYNAPRTAAAATGMQLASQRAQAKPKTLGEREPVSEPAANITSHMSGPRAAANRMSQLAGANPPPAAKLSPVKANPSQANPSQANRIQLTPPSVLESTPEAIAWEPTSSRKAMAASATQQSLGKTVSNPSADGGNFQLDLSSESPAPNVAQSQVEELPRPSAIEDSIELSTESALDSVLSRRALAPVPNPELPAGHEQPAPTPATPAPTIPSQQNSVSISSGPAAQAIPNAPATEPTRSAESEGLPTIDNDAYHSRSRSFSLDYSVESLRGIAIADIELWGTDDRGNTWQKWGSDPDRESPFDVQVGTDGLYGFRMVIIGQNGLVSNRPSDGDAADMWINVDTKIPTVKITRALYGEGPDAGMLVIDYTCDDENLHDRPISLAYSERPAGPWSTIVTGLRNTGIYLWKADPSLPQQVYLRIQAVDRAGNVQEHRLELPINLRGLTPRGRIQGFRPIDPK